MFRFLVLSVALVLTAPAAAQIGRSDGENFLAAIRDGDGGTALPLLNQPGSRIVNFKGFDGEGAIHIVTRKKSMPWLATLLKYDADPNLADSKGDTPLLIATQLNWVDGAERLLRAGARVDDANRRGETPLIRATLLRNYRLVKIFLEKGGDPDRTDYSAGFSARAYAQRDDRNPELLAIFEEMDARGASQGELKFGPIIELPSKED